MPDTIIRINSAPVKLSLFAAQGPAGAAGPAGPNSVTSATTSNGTATLSLSSFSTATGSVSGILNVPTAATATSTLQVASTAFVQQELASGVAVAKNLEFLARNQSGATITKGSIVYINGATGNKPLITLAQANNDANSAQTIGFVKTDIAHNGTGYVIVRGEVEDLNTFALTEGDQLYLSPTVAGSWTTTKPVAPQHLVYVGICLKAHVNQGIILVAIQNGYELNELHDVLITTPAAKQVVKRNAGNTLWINEAVAASDVTGLGSLATQNGTFSGDSSGTNTGDQDLSNLLSRRTYLEVNGTTPSFGPYLVDQDYLTNGRRVWLDGSGGSLFWDTVSWVLELDSGGIIYRATKASSSYEPWLLTGWTVVVGSGQPTFDADPLITNSADPLGSGVSLALYLPADTNGGFLTAGTGGTLPIARGGTGATTAPLARTALGSGATGDALFTAATPAAARTTLELGTTDSPTFGGLDLLTATTTTLNVYNSLSGANFERLSFRWASNIARIGTAKGGTATARDLVLETDGTERMRVSATGNVGIGTSTPTAVGKLTVAGDTAGAALVSIVNSQNRGITIRPAGDGGSVGGAIFSEVGPANGFRFAGGVRPEVNLTTDLGTAGVAWLNVYARNIRGRNNASEGDLNLRSGHGSRPLTFGIDTTEHARVHTDGKVGIGTTSPSALLDVNSDTVRVRTARTPESATAAGNAGDICWDANYIYVCTATNTWKRTQISTWP